MDPLISNTMKFSAKSKGLLMTAFILLTFISVRAASSYSITVEGEVNVSAFPAVEAKLKIVGDSAVLLPRDLIILENGIENHGALVLLPPGAPATKIDLHVLIDEGILGANRDVINKKLEELTDYLKASGLGDRVLTYSVKSDEYGGLDAFSKIRDEIVPVAQSNRQNVLLIVNGARFYDHDRGDYSMECSATCASEALKEKGFATFVVGMPFKTLQTFNTENTDFFGFDGLLAGGYLGSFSTDYTRIVDWLKNRDTTHFTLYYTSQLKLTPENEASGAGVTIVTPGYLGDGGHFNLPAITPTAPIFSYLTAPSVMLGNPVPIRIEVNPNGKMIAEAELTYQNKASAFQAQLLKLSRATSTPEVLVYEGEIPKGDYPTEALNYFVKLYTPFDLVGTGDDMTNVAVESVDDGIILKSQLVNNKEVLWSWSGPTVNMGDEYEIWEGDKKLNVSSLVARNYSIPITECNRYQIVKVRVKLRKGVDHPRAGDWSLFSRPGEYYYPDQGVTQDSVTEAFGVSKLVECLDKSSFETPAAFIASERGYRASANLTLNKTLYYVTAIMDPSLKLDTDLLDRYSLLYLFMDVIGQADYDQYSPDTVNLPVKLLYKAITAANQIGDLKTVFKDSLDELAIRLRGNTSI